MNICCSQEATVNLVLELGIEIQDFKCCCFLRVLDEMTDVWHLEK